MYRLRHHLLVLRIVAERPGDFVGQRPDFVLRPPFVVLGPPF